ncbi:fumarylacetoacetate hydrolase family protein [Nocardioides sp. AE5]|uniref:fumarylacetoacetate hydrolase family protein n=1 Tax=Nocardioides sp. AE5 TaxID=2962573 RepID=UPI0028818FA3|nr:fumarylacetoacetate hydrolase family protein [Nocardioides sp. AE5]MDT0202608.1 fumarylacetoacetate hydrolase family protein [Nocardioides sp. AE5]
MPWATVTTRHGPRIGLVHDDGIRIAHDDRTMIDLIQGGRAMIGTLARELLNRPFEVVGQDDARVQSPIPRPPAIRDALCFLEHMRGCMRALGRSDQLAPVWEEIPAFYFGNPASVIGPYADAQVSPGAQWWDLELEVGVVISKPARDISVTEAGGHIAGYTFFCDWTARDLQVKDLEMGLGQGKGKDGATTLGPWLVTAEEVADHTRDGRLDLRVAATVNGETLATGSTADMDWTFEQVIAFASRGTELAPGDIIGSGTIPGGCLLEHATAQTLADEKTWLRVGDEVSLHGEALGATRQRVTASAKPHPLHLS